MIKPFLQRRVGVAAIIASESRSAEQHQKKHKPSHRRLRLLQQSRSKASSALPDHQPDDAANQPQKPADCRCEEKRSMGAMMPPRRPNSRARRRFHLWGLDRKRGAFIANARPIGDLATWSVDDPNTGGSSPRAVSIQTAAVPKASNAAKISMNIDIELSPSALSQRHRLSHAGPFLS